MGGTDEREDGERETRGCCEARGHLTGPLPKVPYVVAWTVSSSQATAETLGDRRRQQYVVAVLEEREFGFSQVKEGSLLLKINVGVYLSPILICAPRTVNYVLLFSHDRVRPLSILHSDSIPPGESLSEGYVTTVVKEHSFHSMITSWSQLFVRGG